jgi:hypothetical protein
MDENHPGGISMTRAIVAGTMTALLVTVAAQAEPVAYTWTGMGVNVPGSAKCATYKMTIDVTVDGTAVKGTFQQQGRDQRHFEVPLDGKGKFKGKAAVGGGTMDVSGVISQKESTVLLDGYCTFGGKLTNK